MNTRPSPLGDWLTASATRFPDQVAVEETAGGTRLTYAALEERAEALANALAVAGVHGGDRVATLGRNSADQVVALFACAKRRLLMTPLSWRSAPRELAAVLADAEPAVLLVGDEHATLAAQASDRLATPPRIDRLGVGAPAPAGDPEASPPEPVPVDAPVLLIYTSGSTGRPKGVPLSHRTCWSTNRSFGGRFPLTSQDVVLVMLPQFHVGAWNVQPLLAWQTGARVLLPPSFDAGVVLEAIERERVTAMMGVPTTYRLLSEHPAFPTTDLSSLRTVVVGGAPPEAPVLSAWERRGVRLAAGYGLTEAGPNVLCEPPETAGSGGGMVPYPDVRVALRDVASGALVDGTGRGELLVRSGGVFSGYWRNDEATRQVLRDGWLVTGDVAERLPDGGYRLAGRTSEMFISGGENVQPREVEQALLRHPAVAAVSVVGVADRTWGEAGVAFVVPRAGREVTEEELRAFTREHLAGFKVPRQVVVCDDLPLTGSGKIDKRALRARIEGQG